MFKRLLSLIFVAIIAASLFTPTAEARKNPGEKVGATFDKITHDLGNISADSEPISIVFTLTNSGDAALSIIAAQAGCGCTTPSYNHKPLSPGESTEIKVKYNPDGQRGEINKDIVIRLKNGKKASESVVLNIIGVVIPSSTN